MDEQLRGKKGVFEKLEILSGKLDEIVAAQCQTDTDIHMISDSIDVIVDTSDMVFDMIEFIKEKSVELKEVSAYHREEAENAVEEICNLIQECQTIIDKAEEEKMKKQVSEMILHMESLAEFISEKIVAGYEDFITMAEGYEHDMEMIDHSLCEYTDMSHDIQNVVRNIADSVDEITEASEEISKEVKELIEEKAEE